MKQAAAAPAWVDPLRWDLLPLLRQKAGLRVDTRAHLNLEAWLDAAQERGWLTGAPASARGAMRAILCKSAREQAAFDAVFDDWEKAWDIAPALKGQAKGAAVGGQSGGSVHRVSWLRINLGRLIGCVLVVFIVAAGAYGYMLRQQHLAAELATKAAAEAAAKAQAEAAAKAEAEARARALAGGTGKFVPELQVELPSAAESARVTAAAAGSQFKGDEEPSSPWLFGIHPAFYAALVIFAAGAGFAVRRTRKNYIQRITTRENLREQEVFARQLLPVSGTRREGLRRAVRLLRRPDPGTLRELDILSSVRASAARAGLFNAVYRQRPVTPEYLVLVDRLRAGDQQAHWAIETVRDLAAEGVRLTLYEFDRDPRWVAPLHTQRGSRSPLPQRYVPLATLAAQHAGQGLLILGDGQGLLDHANGRLQPWLARVLAAWPRRVLMTPTPMATWGAAEDVLAGEGQPTHEPSFLLVPSQFDAWLAAARWFRRGEVMALGPLPGAPAEWPPSLADEPARWLSRGAPADAELHALLEQLRAFLGPTAFTWLAASAAYPLLSADLTAYLAYQLPDPTMPGAPAMPAPVPDARLLEARLVAIAQLPWCRHGLMPDWLRRALLLSLPLATRRQMREVIKRLFNMAGDAGGISLGQVATDPPPATGMQWWRSMAARIGLAGVLEEEPIDSPLRDVIYLGVLRGEFDVELNQEATEKFARAARAEGQQTITRNPLRWLAAGALTGWFALTLLGWYGRRAARAGVVGFRKAFRSTSQNDQGNADSVSAPLVSEELPQADRSAKIASMVATGAKVAAAALPSVYISYRRSDSKITTTLHAQLQRSLQYPLFLDASNISAGENFAVALERAIGSASTVLALIGHDWLRGSDDWVSNEIATAMRMGKTVLPVLLDGARLPPAEDLPEELQGLVRLSTFELGASTLEQDAQRIAEALTNLLDPIKVANPSQPGSDRGSP